MGSMHVRIYLIASGYWQLSPGRRSSRNLHTFTQHRNPGLKFMHEVITDSAELECHVAMIFFPDTAGLQHALPAAPLRPGTACAGASCQLTPGIGTSQAREHSTAVTHAC